MRFFVPERDLEALQALSALCHPTRQPRAPLWWQIFPTVVVDDDAGRVIAYTQFSFAEITMYLYDTGVHPDHRREGLGRRLMAERIMLGKRLGGTRCIGMTAQSNGPMKLLLAQAKFTPVEMIADYYKELTPVEAGIRYVSSPATFEWAAQQTAVAVEA